MLNELAQQIHEAAEEKGFWDKERNTGELLMLIVSELSEALEADRKGRRGQLNNFIRDLEYAQFTIDDFNLDDRDNYRWIANRFETTIKDTFEDEIADALIRILDLCAAMGIDIDLHIKAKLRYNLGRPKKHGKAY